MNTSHLQVKLRLREVKKLFQIVCQTQIHFVAMWLSRVYVPNGHTMLQLSYI